jgi:hypothetical protein
MFRKIFPKGKKGTASQKAPDDEAASGLSQPLALVSQPDVARSQLGSQPGAARSQLVPMPVVAGSPSLSAHTIIPKKFGRPSARILGMTKMVKVPSNLNILDEISSVGMAKLVDARGDRATGITTIRHSASREER